MWEGLDVRLDMIRNPKTRVLFAAAVSQAMVGGALTESSRGSTATVELVTLSAPSATDISASLPISEPTFRSGDTFFMEAWAQTDAPNGFAQVSMDIAFDAARLTGIEITHSAAFGLFPEGAIDHLAGRIDNLSGSHPPATPPCSDQVGFAPEWVRVASIEVHADATGSVMIQSVDSGDPVFTVSICDSFVPPTVQYGGTTVMIEEAVASIELVVTASPTPFDEALALPASVTDFDAGTLFHAEVWAQTREAKGLAQVSTTLLFDSSLMSAVSIDHSALFNLFANGDIDNAIGRVNSLSGSHSPAIPPCSDSVGAAPNWVRVASVEMSADSSGTAVIQATSTGDPFFVVSHCDSFSLPPAVYGAASVTLIVHPPSAETNGSGKNRYISFEPGNANVMTALRATLTDLPTPFDQYDGTAMWIGQPQSRSEHGGSQGSTAGHPDFMWAPLQCTPVFLDWSGVGVVHASGSAIVPGSVIDIQSIVLGKDTAVGSNYSAPLTVSTAQVWGDIVSDCTTQPCGPPDGQVTIPTDAVSVLDKFASRPSAPIKARVDLDPAVPDQVISITDVVRVVDGFRGASYPFLIDALPCSP